LTLAGLGILSSGSDGADVVLGADGVLPRALRLISSAGLSKRANVISKKGYLRDKNRRSYWKRCAEIKFYPEDVGGALDLFFAPSGARLPTFRCFEARGALGPESGAAVLLEARVVFGTAVFGAASGKVSSITWASGSGEAGSMEYA
jgi:hypothetical protein